MPTTADARVQHDIGYVRGLLRAVETIGPIGNRPAAAIQQLIDWGQLKPGDIMQTTVAGGWLKLYEFRSMYWEGPTVLVQQLPRVDLEVKHYERVRAELLDLGRDPHEIDEHLGRLAEEMER